MAKKSKTYRGQRAYREACKSTCDCFYCTGYSKSHLQRKREIEANKEIINNVFSYSVSDTEGAVCETCLHYPRNLTNKTCAECDDCDNWEAS